jgi:2-amino-4-hydroxy-6-hydroxymethyldihydropteridine diphosphokinase
VRTRAFIGIGSNLGDRQTNCRKALDGVGDLSTTAVIRASPFIELAPAEGVAGGPFLNGVAEIATGLPPRQLLHGLRAIEVALGREADHDRGRARTIDLDLLLYSDLVLNEGDLIIPHPRLATRRFVLEPLASIAPTLRHPVLLVTAEELLRRLGDTTPAGESGARG